MAAPAEVSEKRSNFRIRQFKENRLFNIAANLTLNTMASFVILLIAHTARIACSDRHTYRQTDRQTHTRDNYCNPLCACAPRVNYALRYPKKVPNLTVSSHLRCPPPSPPPTYLAAPSLSLLPNAFPCLPPKANHPSLHQRY